MELINGKATKHGCVAKTAVFLLISLFPFQAFSEDFSDDMKSKNRFYVSGAYKSSFSNFGGLNVEESKTSVPNKGTVQKMSMKGGTTPNIDKFSTFGSYRSSHYENDYFGFSGSVGYAIGALRIELETMQNEFKVRGGNGSVHEDDPSYIALVREAAITETNYVVVKNKKIGISSVAFNICYDINAQADPIVSYLCLGISGNSLDILETKKITHGYYGKIGVGILVTDKVVLSFGGYYHVLHDNDFDSIKLLVPSAAVLSPKPTTAHAKISLSYLGGELGLRYYF